MTNTTKLPNKLSALLRLAVADAQKCEAMPEVYRLDMSHWHSPTDDGCLVCMAGAVIAQTLRLDSASEYSYGELDDDEEDAVSAINEMRIGEFSEAANYMTIGWSLAQEAAVERATALVKAGFDGGKMRADWPTYLEAATILEGVDL